MNDQLDENVPATATDQEARQWALFLHLSVFAGYLVPLAGLIAPIAIWQLKKDQIPGINEHGKNLMNFMISMFIYSLVAGLLTFVLIGFLILPILLIVGIALPIMAAIKGNNGEIWKYPLTIQFLK